VLERSRLIHETPEKHRLRGAAEWLSSVRSTVADRAAEWLARRPQPVQQGWRLLHRTGRETIEDRVPGLAAEAALFTLLSMPALLLAIVGSLGFIAAALGPAGTRELHRILELPHAVLSEPTFDAYQQVVTTVLSQQRGGVVSLGILFSAWTASRAVNRYLETITLAYDVSPRPAWKRRLVAAGLTLGALCCAVAVLPPLVIGPRLVRWAAPDAVAETTLTLLHLLFWPAVLTLAMVALTTLYHLGVPWRTPWRRDIPGAVLAVGLWLLASAGLRAYLTLTVQRGAVYGQLAVPIAVVLWLYLTAFAVLLGAELNSEIEHLWPHDKHPWRIPWRRLFPKRLRSRGVAD